MKYKGGSIALVLLFLLLLPSLGIASSLLISWNANTESDLMGYKLYYGTESKTYGTPLTLGKVTSCSLANVSNGKTYYVAVTAFDTSGNESLFSPEVSAWVPAVISLISPPNGAYLNGTPRFAWSGSGFASYKVYVSPGGRGFTRIYRGTGTSYTMSSPFWSLLVPSGTRVFWYVEGTSPNGTVTTSAVYSFRKQ